MINVAVIGAGQLGSRHLQGLSQVNEIHNIYVCDPSSESLRIAEERYLQTCTIDATVHYITEISALPTHLDLCIVASNSGPRLDILKALTKASNVKYLVLEKVLFTMISQYNEAAEIITNHKIKTWVNCPRRSYPDYISLKNDLGKVETLHMDVHMPGFAIASNAIHFMDLFVYLTGNQDIQINSDDLSSSPIEAKRSGYKEVNGKVIITNSIGSLTINNNCSGAISQAVYITTNNNRIVVQESHSPMLLNASAQNNWSFASSAFRMPFQSELTINLAKSLLNTGTCLLPTYEESMHQHLVWQLALKHKYGVEIPIS